jgi:bacterioferritin-associated ferredoxin
MTSSSPFWQSSLIRFLHPMQLDDELCLCFHVSWRKILNYLRIQKVQHASQLSECGGAGTGCGWCRRSLIRVCEAAKKSPPQSEHLVEWLLANSPSKRQYAEGRQQYLAEGLGTPPASADEGSGSRDESGTSES